MLRTICRPLVVISVMGVLSLAISASQAEVINVQMAGAATTPYAGVGAAPDNGKVWNVLATNQSAAALRNSQGQTTGVSFSAVAQSAGNYIYPGKAGLLAHAAFVDKTHPRANFTISGLQPRKIYALYLYGINGGQGCTFFVNNAKVGATGSQSSDSSAKAITQFDQGDSYIVASATANARGDIAVAWSSNGVTQFGPFNGVQIVGPMSQPAAAQLAQGQVNYGAAKANASRAPSGLIMHGSDHYHYLALKNHRGPSGVPLGGIGVGCFDLAPNGHFTRIAINNWHTGGVNRVPATFLAVSQGGHVQLLELRDAPLFGMMPVRSIVYRGLFPIVHMHVGDNIEVTAWSGLVPHDIKDSSLPVAFINVTVRNPGPKTESVGVAFSWQDVLGHGLRDLKSAAEITHIKDVYWSMNSLPHQGLHVMPPIRTWSIAYAVRGWQGFKQCCQPIIPLRATFQNYNDQVAVMCREQKGQEISLLPAYRVNQGAKAWKYFASHGRLPDAAGKAAAVSQRRFPLSTPKHQGASAVAANIQVPAHSNRTVHFMVGWYAPPLHCGDRPGEVPSYLTYIPDQYGRYFQNFFGSLGQILDYAGAQAERILTQSSVWQKPILNSSYPDWLKFKLINSAYTMYTNTILNKQGDFAVMEGGMGGLTGTMDQRLINHEFYLKFFPRLDLRELSEFADHPGPQGNILHFDGDYYFGIATLHGPTPTPGSWMLDNSGGWLFQLAEYYRQTGDLAYVRRYGALIRCAAEFLHGQITGKVQIPQGPNTYDDFWQPTINAYSGSTYPVFMRCAAVLTRALGHANDAERFDHWANEGTHSLLRYLWNGRYFSYGCDADGGKPVNDLMSSAQLAGQFLSRYLGLGDAIPFKVMQASLIAQMKTNLVHSPDYYAPKVWSIPLEHAALQPGTKDRYSTCWPFQLEAFTAMPLIQAGYVGDGLDIMKNIQLVNLRNGWTWTQNLWNPGELTYVSAPVTWLVTDVLASAALDLPHHTLNLAPLFLPGQTTISLPLYYPGFWAVLSADRRTKVVQFRITKLFSREKAGMLVDQIIAGPVGNPTARAAVFKIPPFAIRAGATLEFKASGNSPHFAQSGNKLTVWTRRMNDFFSQKLRKPVLSGAAAVPFMHVVAGVRPM
ncbi:MAG: GH116 family glycosyl-hydrolase [Phycisphaerae bacterium]